MGADDADPSPDDELRAETEELMASREAVDEERERYAELFESVPDAVVETDDLGKIAEANAAASDLFGVPARALRGKLLAGFVDPVQRPAVRRALREPPDHELLFVVQRRDGGRRRVAARLGRHLRLGPARSLWALRDLSRSTDLEQRTADAGAAAALFQRLAPLQPLVGSPEARRVLIARVLESTEELLQVALVVKLEGDESICGDHDLGGRLAELERSVADGPMTEAITGSRTVVAQGSELATRWSAVGGRALELRATGVTAVPILVGAEPIGAVAAWHRTDDDKDVLPALLVLAEQLGTAASNAALFAAVQDTEVNLRRALETRGVIEQAKGVLMQARNVTADEAFDLLREQSQRTNRKLREVAVDLIERRSGMALDDRSG